MIANVKQFLLQWNIAQRNKTQSRYPYFMERDGNEFWVALQADYMKISVDVLIFTVYNASGLGVMVRYDKVELI